MHEVFYLLGTLAAFNGADGEAEASGPWEIRNVHVIQQPLIPSARLKGQNLDQVKGDIIHSTKRHLL